MNETKKDLEAKVADLTEKLAGAASSEDLKKLANEDVYKRQYSRWAEVATLLLNWVMQNGPPAYLYIRRI